VGKHANFTLVTPVSTPHRPLSPQTDAELPLPCCTVVVTGTRRDVRRILRDL
jgi:hypothetical protein